MKVTREMLAKDRNWGEIELYRHQHGTLPQPEGCKPLIYSEALIKAAEAVREGKVNPFNAAEMLKVAGLKLQDLGK